MTGHSFFVKSSDLVPWVILGLNAKTVIGWMVEILFRGRSVFVYKDPRRISKSQAVFQAANFLFRLLHFH
jgi:hypothetical protein